MSIMHICAVTSLEILEQRIAPAGLVTATFSQGLLSVTGTDGADHVVEILKTGANSFRVEGTGTDINNPGQTFKNFHGTLDRVQIEGGSGGDAFKLTKLAPLTSLKFGGDAGVDSLNTTNLKIRAGGHVAIDLGSGTGSVVFGGNNTAIHGRLAVDMGGGGTVDFSSTSTLVTRAVTISGGPAADMVSVTGDTTLFKRTLTVEGGDGNDSFNATGGTLKVKGIVTMDGGAGANNYVFAADTQIFGKRLTPGLVDLNLGTGPGNVTFLGNFTKVFGDLRIDLGDGGGTAHLNSDVTHVRDHVQVTGGVGNDSLEFTGRTNIGKSLSFVAGAGNDVLKASGDVFAVGKALTMDGGSGDEASRFDLNVVALALGELTVTGGTSNDQVSIIADGTIAGNANLQLGLDGVGPSSTIVKSRAGLANGLKIGGALTIHMVGATVDSLTIANVEVAKDFVAQTGEGVSTINLFRLNVLSDFSLGSGTGADVVNITNVDARDFNVDAGIGADVVNIDNFNARDFNVDTGIGADELRIERNALFTGNSLVRGIATIVTGIGADEIRIGNSINPADLKVSFQSAMTLDAGDGANNRNDIQGSNSFAAIPTILATGGTLTETAAV